MSASDRARDVLARIVTAQGFERLLISLSALALSIVIGAFIVLGAGRMASCQTAAYTLAFPGSLITQFTGGGSLVAMGFCYDPFAVYDKLFVGAMGNLVVNFSTMTFSWNPLNGQMATTLAETTILAFTGVAVAVAFRAGVFNIGAQGQLVVGALLTAVAMLFVAPWFAGLGVLGTALALAVGLLFGALGGGLYGAVPGALKAYADANEVITTIMLNFVATSVALWLVSTESLFKDPESFANQTKVLPEFSRFPAVVFRARDDFSVLALAAAVLALVGIWYLLTRTSFGYDLRTSGIQPDAAEYGGVDADRTVVASMALSGALAGVGGAVYVLMVLGNFQTGVPAYGFDGITVSILAGNNPLGVGFAAFLFGVLKSGSIVVQVGSDVPPELVGVLRGLIILFVAMPEFFRMAGRKFGSFVPESEDRTAVAADGGVRDE